MPSLKKWGPQIRSYNIQLDPFWGVVILPKCRVVEKEKSFGTCLLVRNFVASIWPQSWAALCDPRHPWSCLACKAARAVLSTGQPIQREPSWRSPCKANLLVNGAALTNGPLFLKGQPLQTAPWQSGHTDKMLTTTWIWCHLIQFTFYHI